jgi:hypothetical protein
VHKEQQLNYLKGVVYNSTLMLSYDDSGADLACAATSLQTVVPFQALAAFNGENPQGIGL